MAVHCGSHGILLWQRKAPHVDSNFPLSYCPLSAGPEAVSPYLAGEGRVVASFRLLCDCLPRMGAVNNESHGTEWTSGTRRCPSSRSSQVEVILNVAIVPAGVQGS